MEKNKDNIKKNKEKHENWTSNPFAKKHILQYYYNNITKLKKYKGDWE